MKTAISVLAALLLLEQPALGLDQAAICRTVSQAVQNSANDFAAIKGIYYPPYLEESGYWVATVPPVEGLSDCDIKARTADRPTFFSCEANETSVEQLATVLAACLPDWSRTDDKDDSGGPLVYFHKGATVVVAGTSSSSALGTVVNLSIGVVPQHE